MSGDTPNSDLNHRLLHRMVFFTDAVFAIVMTLLVLELRPPEAMSSQELGAGLAAMWPTFFAFLLSFIVTGMFWVGHLAISRSLTEFDWPVTVANLVFLCAVAVVPFGAALLGEHSAMVAAWQFYSGLMILAGLSQTVLWLIVSRDGGRLMGGIEPRERLRRALRALSPAMGFVCALGLISIGQLGLARLSGCLIPIFLFAIGRLLPDPIKMEQEVSQMSSDQT